MGGVYLTAAGTPAPGTYAYIDSPKFDAVGGARYECSVYLSAHRCVGKLSVIWYDINGTYLGETGNTTGVTTANGGALSNWDRSTAFFDAPAGTTAVVVRAFALFDGRDNPYLFASGFFVALAGPNQTEFTPWSDGAPGLITASNATTYIADLAVNTLQIANQAVTIPLGAEAGYYGDITANNTYVTVVSAPTLVSTGAPVVVIISIGYRFYANGGTYGRVTWRLLRNGATAWSQNTGQSIASAVGDGAVFTRMIYFSSLGAGNHTFDMQMGFTSDATVPHLYPDYRSILVMEVKK
jgi:hypothetical protein